MQRAVDCKLWDDPKVRALPRDAKLLFVYLITNRHTHLSGIYKLPQVLAEYELRVDDLSGSFDTLQAEGLVHRDTAEDLVWVREMFTYQAKTKEGGTRSRKQLKAAALQLENLHASFLLIKFLHHYPEVREHLSRAMPEIPSPDPTDRVSAPSKAKAKAQVQTKVKVQDKAQKKNSGAEVGQLPESLDTPEFKSTWDQWIEYRREIRKPLTVTTVDRQMKALERWGSEKAVEALELSMRSGWTGVFDPDGKRGEKGKATRFKPKVTDEIAEWADSTIQDYS